ncbi:MAG TPA: hypothetical protein VIW28_01775 [Gemmatimonadales bacterium]
MNRRLQQAAVVFVVVLAAAQLVRPERANPATNQSHTIQAQVGTAVNFSEWAAYPPEVQRNLLAESCADASTGKMPGVYTRLQPETRLSARDIETICAASRQIQAPTAKASP